MPNATIKDVAREAGVSIATVSRVLNNNGPVSRDSVGRVNAAIAKLNYYPNSIARTLKSDASKTIGFVVSDISNSFFTAMARSVEDVLNEKGYNLIVCSTDDDPKREYSCLVLLREKKVDGIIMNASGGNVSFIADMSQSIPIALFGRKVPNAKFKGDFVDNDNFTGLFNLTSYLISLGHSDIGLINGQPYVSSSAERMAGFCSAMKTVGIAVNENYPFLYHGHFSQISSGVNGAEALLGMEKRPTAIIAANNLLATGVMRYCLLNGISIPDAVSLCSFGTLNNHDLLCVKLTCVDQAPSSMGARLAELIIERIEMKNDVPNREVRFATQFLPGDSVKKKEPAKT